MGFSASFSSGDFRILFPLFLIAVFLAAAWKWIYSSRQGKIVLILGASGSGKTTLFHQLRDGTSHRGTVPSMVENKDTIYLRLEKENVGKNSRAVDVIDIPGHPKVRHKAAQYYRSTKKLVFVVDSVDFMAQKGDVAEQLFEVISDPVLLKQKASLLILCNKHDQGAKAHTSDFLRKRLEKEVEALRSTRASLWDAPSLLNDLAKRGEPFNFAGLTNPKISVATGSALTGDLDAVCAFLS